MISSVSRPNANFISSSLSREVAELQERRQRAANPEDATLVMYAILIS
jgi:hypothetical protein